MVNNEQESWPELPSPESVVAMPQWQGTIGATLVTLSVPGRYRYRRNDKTLPVCACLAEVFLPGENPWRLWLWALPTVAGNAPFEFFKNVGIWAMANHLVEYRRLLGRRFATMEITTADAEDV